MNTEAAKQKILNELKYCQRHRATPDLHSFTISTKCGAAYVSAVEKKIEIIREVDGERVTERLTIDEAAELLISLDADPSSIEM